jgi:hypothetical protein
MSHPANVALVVVGVVMALGYVALIWYVLRGRQDPS